MSAAIIAFTGRAERDAQANLAAFIEHSKGHRFFSGEQAIVWASDTWDLRGHLLKRTSTPPGGVLHFTTLETTRRGSRAADAIIMPEHYCDAAKAIIIEHLRVSRDTNPSRLLIAIRTIEKAFRDIEREPDITDLSPQVLDRAQDIIVEKYKDAWSIARYLERIAMEYARPAMITSKPVSWKTSVEFKAPIRNDRVNADGAKGNTDKLPRMQAIFDLASVFHASDYVPDQIITGWFALAMFSPSRVTEILSLPLDCEREIDGVYGLSWKPLKGGEAMTKFAPSDESAQVAKIAINRLKTIGKEARLAHRWYEENPDQLFLPPGFEHMRGEPLTIWEVSQILGRSAPISQAGRCDQALVRCGRTEDESRFHPHRLGVVHGVLVTFESLEKFVLGRLPRTFPFIDPREKLRGGDALFCMPHNVFRGSASTENYVPTYVTASIIRHELGSKPKGKTVFSRNGLMDKSTGEAWRLNTHQPRHLLNTIAQSKHLSQELIAYWSGRKSVKQNASYNHLPQESFIEAYLALGESADIKIKVDGPLSEKIGQRMQREHINYDAALRLEVGSTITTRFGLCRHDYSLMPCPKDKDCIRCGENTFIKGNAAQIAEAKAQLQISQKAEEGARAAMAKGRYGAERWVDLHAEKALRWASALEKLTSDELDDGTLITLPPVRHPQSKAGLAKAFRENREDSAGDALRRVEQMSLWLEDLDHDEGPS